MHWKWEGFLLRILRILNMSCLLMSGFKLILNYYCSRNSNICDILSVLIPSPYPYPYPQFFDRSIPVLTPYHIFKKIQYPYPYPYRFFKNNPYSSIPRTQNFRFYQYPLLSPYPYLGIYREGVRIPSPYSGVRRGVIFITYSPTHTTQFFLN